MDVENLQKFTVSSRKITIPDNIKDIFTDYEQNIINSILKLLILHLDELVAMDLPDDLRNINNRDLFYILIKYITNSGKIDEAILIRIVSAISSIEEYLELLHAYDTSAGLDEAQRNSSYDSLMKNITIIYFKSLLDPSILFEYNKFFRKKRMGGVDDIFYVNLRVYSLFYNLDKDESVYELADVTDDIEMIYYTANFHEIYIRPSLNATWGYKLLKGVDVKDLADYVVKLLDIRAELSDDSNDYISLLNEFINNGIQNELEYNGYTIRNEKTIKNIIQNELIKYARRNISSKFDEYLRSNGEEDPDYVFKLISQVRPSKETSIFNDSSPSRMETQLKKFTLIKSRGQK